MRVIFLQKTFLKITFLLFFIFTCILFNEELLLGYSIYKYFRHVDREINISNLVKVSTLPPAYELTVQRDLKTGALVGFTEVRMCGNLWI